MKRIALLPLAVSVLSLFLVACGPGISEKSVEIQQDSAGTRRLSGEDWARQQEAKARSNFNAEGRQDPILGRINSSAVGNSLQGDSQPYPTGMSLSAGQTDSSSTDLLKMGAIGIAMMAITQGFNGEKLAGALGVDDSDESESSGESDEKEESASETEQPSSMLIASDSAQPTKSHQSSFQSGTSEMEIENSSTLSVIIEDAREDKSVKNNEEPRTNTESQDEPTAAPGETTSAEQIEVISLSSKTEELKQATTREPDVGSSHFQIVSYDEVASIDCYVYHPQDDDLSAQINAILSKASVQELGGNQ